MKFLDKFKNYISKEFIIFTLVRIIGVGIKPLIIFFFLKNFDPIYANNFALILSIISSLFIVLGNANHRKIYELFISNQQSKSNLSGKQLFIEYLNGQICHIIIFIPICLLFCFAWTNDYFLILLIIPLLVVEKYFDESQRSLIYKKEYLRWSENFVFRVFLPCIFLILFSKISYMFALLMYTVSSIIFCLIYIIRFQSKFNKILIVYTKKLLRNLFNQNVTNFKNYIVEYKNEYFLTQLFLFLSLNFTVFDKFLVNKIFKDNFAEYILLGQIFNISVILHSMFYFTIIRPKLINKKTNINKLFLSTENLLLPFLSSTFILLFLITIKYYFYQLTKLPISVHISLSALFFLASINLIIIETAFWRIRRDILIYVFIFFISLMSLILIPYKISIWYIPLAMSISTLIVTLILLGFCNSKSDKIRIK